MQLSSEVLSLDGAREIKKKEAKRAYQREYYQKNKKRILKNAKKRAEGKTSQTQEEDPAEDGQLSFDFFSTPSAAKKLEPARVALGVLSLLPTALIIAVGTWFLVAENTLFYATNDTGAIPPVVKALLVEGMLLALSFATATNWIQKTVNVTFLTLLLVYSSIGFSTHLFKQKTGSIQSNELLQQELEGLNKAISLGQATSLELLEKGWAGRLRDVQEDLSQKELRKQEVLKQIRTGSVSSKKTEEATLYALLLFRALVQGGLIYFTKLLKRQITRIF